MENSINNDNYFFSSKNDNDEERVMYSESDNIKNMISMEADQVIKKLFDSLRNRYQNNLKSLRDSNFVLDYVQLLYYKCQKINLHRGGSYIDSSDKKQKSNNKSHQ